jgi:hypothetical protein
MGTERNGRKKGGKGRTRKKRREWKRKRGNASLSAKRGGMGVEGAGTFKKFGDRKAVGEPGVEGENKARERERAKTPNKQTKKDNGIPRSPILCHLTFQNDIFRISSEKMSQLLSIIMKSSLINI